MTHRADGVEVPERVGGVPGRSRPRAGSSAPIRRVALRNLAAHKVRLFLSVLAVMLGASFVTGSFVFTDTLRNAFSGIFDNVAVGVDLRLVSGPAGATAVPLDTVDAAKALPHVRAAVAGVQGSIILLNPAGGAVPTGGAPSQGQLYVPSDQAIQSGFELAEGREPSAEGEVVINESAARRGGIKVGDKTTVILPRLTIAQVPVTVVGTVQMAADVGGFIGVWFTRDQAISLFTDGQHASYVDIAGDGGDPQVLREEVAHAFPSLRVMTGDDVREEAQAGLQTALSFINYFLLAFGAVALLVSTFIIYNTFSMIVAQRARELALLRAIGASGRQVSASITFEAAIVGVVGSSIGVGVGVGIAYAVRAVLNAFDLGLPNGPLTLAARTVVLALTVGIVVTVVSAYGPARRASKTPPVEAMRAPLVSVGDSLRRRTWIGAVLGALGGATLAAGGLQGGRDAAILVGVGATALIVATFLVTARWSQPVVAALGTLIKPLSTIGQIAVQNARRSPKRTAATAFALTLGVMLVTIISILGGSAKHSFDDLVDSGINADYVLSPPQQQVVPHQVEAAAARVPGVESVAAIRPLPLNLGGSTVYATSLAGAQGALHVTLVDGTQNLGPNDFLLMDDEAKSRGLAVGDTATIRANDKTVEATLVGIFSGPATTGTARVANEIYEQLVPESARFDALVLVKATPDANLPALRTALTQAVKPFVIVEVLDKEQFKGTQGAQIDQMMGILYGLLTLAVIIAVLGIVNTLALSVVERRTEIGMLRAVGMLRSQVRRSFYVESALIAAIGAVAGVALGLAIGSAFIRTMHSYGLSAIVIPWGQVASMIVASVLVGVLAAVIPAIQAARTPALEAISE